MQDTVAKRAFKGASIDWENVHLEKGKHGSLEGAYCAMEFASILAGEAFSDQPSCVSPFLRSLSINYNDSASDEDRQRLIPFIPRMIGTAGDEGADLERAVTMLNWLTHKATPVWLRLAKLEDEARQLEELPDWTAESVVEDLARAIASASARAIASAIARASARARARAIASAIARASARARARAIASAIASASASAYDLADNLDTIAWDCAYIVGLEACTALEAEKGGTQTDEAYSAAIVAALKPTADKLTDEFFALLDSVLPQLTPAPAGVA